MQPDRKYLCSATRVHSKRIFLNVNSEANISLAYTKFQI